MSERYMSRQLAKRAIEVMPAVNVSNGEENFWIQFASRVAIVCQNDSPVARF
jgi:hypothetical protein